MRSISRRPLTGGRHASSTSCPPSSRSTVLTCFRYTASGKQMGPTVPALPPGQANINSMMYLRKAGESDRDRNRRVLKLMFFQLLGKLPF